MAMDLTTLKVDRADGIVTITINRPEKKNAMSPQLHREMLGTLRELRDDWSVRVIVLTGAGDSFCAGQDLKEFFAETHGKPEESQRVTRMAMEWGELLRLNDKPTIARVNGWCFGGGMRVMGLCDIAIASDRAVFGLSEINFGIFPAGGALKVPVELLSHRDALYLALTGERLSAAEAEKIRLVNRAVPHERLDAEVAALAEKLKDKNPVALMLTKKVFWREKFMEYNEAVDWELANFAVLDQMTAGEWVSEGIQQFLQGRYRPGLEAYRRKTS
jgi:trans-feruloyl-CoA hydratase/vanillin synthase